MFQPEIESSAEVSTLGSAHVELNTLSKAFQIENGSVGKHRAKQGNH